MQFLNVRRHHDRNTFRILMSSSAIGRLVNAVRYDSISQTTLRFYFGASVTDLHDLQQSSFRCRGFYFLSIFVHC